MPTAMASFLRATALLTGIANATLFWFATSSEALFGDDAGDRYWPHGVVFVVLAGVAGLLTAEALLRARRPIHESSFFTRFAYMVLGIMLGGALVGLALEVANLMFYVDPASGNTVTGILFSAPLIMMLGGFVGLVEGLAFALPLAAILGLYGSGVQSQP